jgi:hypothetical protein
MSHLELQIKALTQQVELLTARIIVELQAESQHLKLENSRLRKQNDQFRDKIARLEKTPLIRPSRHRLILSILSRVGRKRRNGESVAKKDTRSTPASRSRLTKSIEL